MESKTRCYEINQKGRSKRGQTDRSDKNTGEVAFGRPVKQCKRGGGGDLEKREKNKGGHHQLTRKKAGILKPCTQ